MSAYYDPEMLDQPPPSTCNRVVCYAWKTITFLFSHITLITMVVSYCLGGAKMFESLERDHELMVKDGIKKIRDNITNHLWNLTKFDLPVLEKDNYTETTKTYLKDFESALLYAMTKDGWDGNENRNETQWTFEGALFYSIIVITTIGYGHIAPKTEWGKVATIFYAILGIPLMLLCLSNVGDILATSFRFLYWKVCCYVCTKKPKRSRRSRSRGASRSTGGRISRSRTTSFRRSVRNSTRSADSGFGLSEITPSSYSDTDLRYHDEYPKVPPRGVSIPRMRPSQQSRFSDSTVPNSRKPQVSRLPRGGSLDRRRAPNYMEPIAPSVLCNRYVVHPREPVVNHVPDIKCDDDDDYHQQNRRRASSPAMQGRRAISMPRTQHYLEPPRPPSPVISVDSFKHRAANRRRKRSPPYNPSPKMMNPLGFGSRQRYVEEPESDTDYYEDDYYEPGVIRTKPVPIWLCVLLVLSYIIAGMFLFHYWENWNHLDAAYFCFITLTTIGFGDYVPSNNNPKKDPKVSIALCSLYLLFGISLLAMSFNLVQEEVLAHVRRIAKTLGIIKSEEAEEEEDE